MSAHAKAARAPEPVDVVEYAEMLVNSRRAAVDLSVDQIRELAAAVLILDQQLDDARRRMASMMLAEPGAPETKRGKETGRGSVPIFIGGNEELAGALEALVQARQRLERERFSGGENLARQNFEKAAIAVTEHCNSPQRK